MIRGITYDKQLFKSNDFSLMTKRFFNNTDGKVNGCALSTSGNTVIIGTGWFIASGYYTNIASQEVVTISQSGTLVYEIDLSKTNTTQTFNQGSFKVITGTPQQDDLFNSGTIYQLAIAEVTTNGITATISSTLWGDIMGDFQTQINNINNKINTEIGTIRVVNFTINMDNMSTSPDLTNKYAYFSDSYNYTNGIIIGSCYKIGNIGNKHEANGSNKNYTVVSDTSSTSLQGRFVVNKAQWEADYYDTYITDKNYYIQILVLMR